MQILYTEDEMCHFCTISTTHQLPFLHALHNHEQDLLRLALAIVEGLLNGDQKLLSDVVIHQAGRGQSPENISDYQVRAKTPREYWCPLNCKPNLTLRPPRICAQKK